MNQNLKNKIKKMKESNYEIYYKSVGERIKKRRIELNLTQEELAKGICSNTYISKIENNHVIAKQEQLSMIMERMHMDKDEIIMPAKLIGYLEDSFDAFFYKDIDKYKKIFDVVENYEFSCLVYIIKLGYYVLIEDFERAKKYNVDLVRYLDNLDDYGFYIYYIYSLYYYIGVNDYVYAKGMMKTVNNEIMVDDKTLSLIYFAQYIVNSFLITLDVANFHYDYISRIFLTYNNEKRLIEQSMYRHIFMIYNSDHLISIISEDHLKKLSDSQINFYLLHVMFSKKNFNQYFPLVKEKGEYYSSILAFKSYYYFKNSESEKYNAIMDKLEKYQCKYKEKVDFYRLIKAIEKNDFINSKVIINNYFMQYLVDNQNIYFIYYFANLISNKLAERKRYKEAKAFLEKYKKIIEDLRSK